MEADEMAEPPSPEVLERIRQLAWENGRHMAILVMETSLRDPDLGAFPVRAFDDPFHSEAVEVRRAAICRRGSQCAGFA